MIPYKSSLLTVVPETLEKRLEIMDAVRRLARQEDEQVHERRATIAALRHDFDGLRRDCDALERVLQQACHEWTRAELRQRLRKYSPDQPRVPAGNPDGGQWTSEDAGRYSGRPLADNGETDATQKPVEYAALESQTRTDAADAPASAQYASETEDDTGENRAGGLFEGTPAQLLRQEIAEREYRAALSEVLRYDPTWKPSPSLIDPNDIEGDIARLEAWTKEAKEYFGRLRGLSKPLDRNTR